MDGRASARSISRGAAAQFEESAEPRRERGARSGAARKKAHSEKVFRVQVSAWNTSQGDPGVCETAETFRRMCGAEARLEFRIDHFGFGAAIFNFVI